MNDRIEWSVAYPAWVLVVLLAFALVAIYLAGRR